MNEKKYCLRKNQGRKYKVFFLCKKNLKKEERKN
jgi:hypothetical protein